jgi:hypothetical protein
MFSVLSYFLANTALHGKRPDKKEFFNNLLFELFRLKILSGKKGLNVYTLIRVA